jgi:hypothetical protein
MGLVVGLILGGTLKGRGAEELATVDAIVNHPTTYHRHIVTIKGVLRVVGQTEGKDSLGQPICGPIFLLKDETGELPVIYTIRCQSEEVQKASAMAGHQVKVTATIEVPGDARLKLDDPSQSIRALASSIQMDDR